MAGPKTTTHIYKTVNGLELTIDVFTPATAQDNNVALIHFHGGFLVSCALHDAVMTKWKLTSIIYSYLETKLRFRLTG